MRIRVPEVLTSTLYPITCSCSVDLGVVCADVFLQSRPRRCMRSHVPVVFTSTLYVLMYSCIVGLGAVCV